MPLVGSIRVEGFTETGAAQAIVRLYRDQNLLQNAAVWVLKINGAAPLPLEPVQPALPPPPKAAQR